MTKVSQVCNLDIDLEADAGTGYPGVICRKCCNLVETFHNFQLTVGEGQKSLAKRVEAEKERKEEEVTLADTEEVMFTVHSPESIGVDPLESSVNDDSNSILPDSDENITIKQEKIAEAGSSQSNGKETSSDQSLTADKTAPMTSLFSDAVAEITDVKVEPDTPTIKKEPNQGGETENDKTNDFSDLANIEITPLTEDKEKDDSIDKDDDSESVDKGDATEQNDDSPSNDDSEQLSTNLDQPEDSSNSSETVTTSTEDEPTDLNKATEQVPEENNDNADSNTENIPSDTADLFQDYFLTSNDGSDSADVGINGEDAPEAEDNSEDLFSDYPDLTGVGDFNCDNGEPSEAMDWMGEDLEDIPGVEVRSHLEDGDDPGEVVNVVPDPLFDIGEEESQHAEVSENIDEDKVVEDSSALIAENIEEQIEKEAISEDVPSNGENNDIGQSELNNSEDKIIQ